MVDEDYIDDIDHRTNHVTPNKDKFIELRKKMYDEVLMIYEESKKYFSNI